MTIRGGPSDQTIRPDTDVRPVVAQDRRPSSLWLPIGVAVLAAILLFAFLDHRRRELTAPSTAPRSADAVQTVSALPPLVIPFLPPPPAPPPEPAVIGPTPATPSIPLVVPQSVPPQIPQPVQPQYVPRPPTPPMPQMQPAAPVQPPSPALPGVLSTRSGGQVLVIDTARPPPTEPAETGVVAEGQATTVAARETVRSSALPRRAMTVPEGTLIPAVLETALDSTRPGFARAVVSRDVTGFDGSRVLIPRGSRLFGEYQSELGAGQNRATVQWTRLVRSDGVTIALSSPAADSRGRAGIEGRVNNRYLERFAGALLQTTLNVGASLAARSIGDGAVIVALPGSSQTTAAAPADSRIQPTLRVEAGTRITVFVAQDLEFSSGAHRR